VRLGDRAREQGRFEEAASAYEKALASNPKNFSVALQLGWCYIELGRSSKAVAGFRKALRLRSASAEAHYGLGLAHQDMGQREDARSEYQKSLDLDPDGRDAAEVRALLSQLR